MAQEATPTPSPGVLAFVRELVELERPAWATRAAAIPAWHPRNEGDDEASSDEQDQSSDDADESADDQADNDDGDDDPRVKKANREAAKYRRQARQAQARIKEIEDAEKSDLEKANDRAQKAEDALAERDAADLRRKIAKKHGLPESFASRLTGDDEDALNEDAEALAAELGETKPRVPQPRRGADDDAGGSEDDPIKLAAKVPRMY